MPLSHGEAIYRALRSAKKDLWIAKDAIHCALFDKYETEWTKRVLSFFETSLAKAQTIDKGSSSSSTVQSS